MTNSNTPTPKLRVLAPRGMLIAALLAPALLPSPAAAEAYQQNARRAEGASDAGINDFRPAYSQTLNGNRSTATRHSVVDRDVAMPPLATNPAEPLAAPHHISQTLPMTALTVGWHAVIARTGRQTADADALKVSETEPGQAAAVRAEQAWARATAPQQKVGGAYVTLTSPADDWLVGISSPIAGRAEVHEMRMDGDVMRMREVEGGLALPAGKVVALAPGGYHIMLMDLKQPLVAGQVIPMQLRFRTAPPLDLRVQVAPVGASAPPGVAASAAPNIEGHAGMPGQVR